MPFLDESESFASGFAMGKLWERMSKNEIISDQVLPANTNAQTILMCESLGYEARVEPISENDILLNAAPINISNIF